MLGFFHVYSELEGRHTLQTLIDSWFFIFISEAWLHLRFNSFTSLCYTWNDKNYFTLKTFLELWTLAWFETFSSVPLNCKAVTRRRHWVEPSVLREGNRGLPRASAVSDSCGNAWASVGGSVPRLTPMLLSLWCVISLLLSTCTYSVHLLWWQQRPWAVYM